jgi:CelD/BcsL family acetyltransferase involved in cellulose biosynthesis/GNAT superfamily N-acetyltransferase
VDQEPAVGRDGSRRGISVYEGAAAEALLRSEDFLAQWRKLFQDCAWGTCFQAPDFACTWYRCYAAVATPLLVASFSATGRLDGLLTLAVEQRTGNLQFAGAHQAEYHAWLAPAGKQTFIVDALEQLHQLRFRRLSFLYLPTGCPLDWLDEKWRSASITRLHRKPLIEIRDAADAHAALQAGRTRKRINRMERLLGPAKFVQLNTAEETNPYFDEIVAFTDLRQGAIHANFPFADDPNKAVFFRELMRTAGLMHTSVLTVGDRLASVQMNFRSGSDVLLGLTCYSPFLAEHSPGKLHFLYLVSLLHQQGILRVDLTPGGDPYKQRLANAHEEVVSLTVFFSRKDLLRDRARASVLSAARTFARAVKLDRRRVSRYVRFGRRAVWHPVSTIRAGLRILGSRLWSRTEIRLYRLGTGEIPNLDGPVDQSIARDSIQDLLRYQPETRTALSRVQFASEALSRIEAEAHVYTCVQDGALAHYGWLNPVQQKSLITEVGCEYEYPPNTAVVWDFYTAPSFRGRGLYTRSLRRILRDLAATPGTDFVYIAVLAENGPSRHVIEKVGFKYYESIIRRRWIWRNSYARARALDSSTP